VSVATIQVLARTRRNSPCRTCGEIVTWFRTFPRERWIAFDADPVALRTTGNPIVGETIEELDRADVHWSHCRPTASQGEGVTG